MTHQNPFYARLGLYSGVVLSSISPALMWFYPEIVYRFHLWALQNPHYLLVVPLVSHGAVLWDVHKKTSQQVFGLCAFSSFIISFGVLAEYMAGTLTLFWVGVVAVIPVAYLVISAIANEDVENRNG